jgi:hypothetical protein
MQERSKHLGLPLVTDDQSAEVLKPGDGPFDFPASAVASEVSTVLTFDFFVRAVGTDQLNPSSLQSSSQRVAVSRSIVNESFRIFPRSASTNPRHGDLLKRRLDQRTLVRRRRGKFDSERHTLAVCHHHKLCTLSAFGLSDLGTPFFAGANVPSAKTSCQSSCPSSSSSDKNARQIESHTPASSHSRNRRQHVVADGYSRGRSFQRAPLRNTQRIPSITSRSSIRRRPPRGDGFPFGNNRSIFNHWASVSSRFMTIEVPPSTVH